MKKNKILYITIFVIVLGFSFFAFNSFKENNEKNVYVINIERTGDPNEISTPDNSGDEVIGDFSVTDAIEDWSNQAALKIFDVSKISPHDNGSYDFIVNNNTNRFIKYILKLDEINEFNANISYRLKRNGVYVVGNENTYLRCDDLNIPEVSIESGKKDLYTLEWKWVEAPNDAEVGYAASKTTATYSLKLSIKYYEPGINDTQENPNTGDKIMIYIGVAIVSLLILIVTIIYYLNSKRRNK